MLTAEIRLTKGTRQELMELTAVVTEAVVQAGQKNIEVYSRMGQGGRRAEPLIQIPDIFPVPPGRQRRGEGSGWRYRP